MNPKFALGQAAYHATWDSEPSTYPCPECGGTKTLTVILWDGAQHIIECEGCNSGFESPRGYLTVYNRHPRTEVVTITGVNTSRGELEYCCQGDHETWGVKEEDLWPTQEEALVRAVEMSRQADEDERAQIDRKEKPERSWSWHVHYHRNCIRRAEKDIVYHSGKLAAARVKAKEPVV